MDAQVNKAIDFLVEDEPLFSNPLVFDDKWLDENVHGFWNRREDGKIDVTGTVMISGLEVEHLPFKFGNVSNSFDCSSNNLLSLEGAPEWVGKIFKCSTNSLTSLKGCPQEIGGDFICVSNDITSLVEGPKKVGGSYLCGTNALTTLKGAPYSVGDSFDCTANELTNLVGGPKEVGDSYYAYGNPLESLEGVATSIGKRLDSKQFTHEDYLKYINKEDVTGGNEMRIIGTDSAGGVDILVDGKKYSYFSVPDSVLKDVKRYMKNAWRGKVMQALTPYAAGVPHISQQKKDTDAQIESAIDIILKEGS